MQKKQMAAAAGDGFERRRQRPMLRDQACERVLALFAVDIEHPKAARRAGRHANVAIGHPPVAPDGFSVAGCVLEAALDDRDLASRLAWEHRTGAPSICERSFKEGHRPSPQDWSASGACNRSTKICD